MHGPAEVVAEPNFARFTFLDVDAWNRWARSASSSCSARAMASRIEAETPAIAPRSSLGSYSTLTPAKAATSARRSPGTLRAPMWGIPACCEVILARREIKNSRTSARLSTPSTLRRTARRLGCLIGTRLDKDSPAAAGRVG